MLRTDGYLLRTGGNIPIVANIVVVPEITIPLNSGMAAAEVAAVSVMDIPAQDVSRVIRLVLEVCDRWDDPRAWREHLLMGACRLLDAHVGTIMNVEMPAPDRTGCVRALANVGFPAEVQRQVLDSALVDASYRTLEDVGQSSLAGIDLLFRQLAQNGWATAAGRELATETEFHASAMYQNFRRPMDCDDYVLSLRTVDIPTRVELIDIDRPHSAPPFGPREATLLKLLHDEIAPLVGVRLTTEEHLSRDGLSKRLRETLSLLLEGRSEKQVAEAAWPERRHHP